MWGDPVRIEPETLFEAICKEARRVYRRMPKSRARKDLAPEAETDDWGRFLKKALPTVTIRGGPLMTLVKKAIGRSRIRHVDAITINNNLMCPRHRDRNASVSWIMHFGRFTNGRLLVEEEGTSRVHSLGGHLKIGCFEKFWGGFVHWNEAHRGDKWSIIVYQKNNKKMFSPMAFEGWHRKSGKKICLLYTSPSPRDRG